MPIDKLKATLEELHRQLEAAEHLDPEDQQRLQSMVEEVQKALARARPQPGTAGKEQAAKSEGGPVERLKQMVEHFEEEHPTLSAAVAELVTALRNMGF